MYSLLTRIREDDRQVNFAAQIIMKILYLANARLPTEKAHGIQIMKMCEAFAEAGNEVELLIPRRVDSRREADIFSFYGVKPIFRITRMTVLDVHGFGIVGYVIRHFSFTVMSVVKSLFKRVDVIYSRDEWPLFLLMLLRKPVCFEAHVKRFNLPIRNLLKVCAPIVCISEGLRAYFLQHGGYVEAIFITQDGVDVRMFERIKSSKRELRKELGLPEKAQIVGYIGKYKTMGKGKGVDELIRMMPPLLAKVSDAFLLLVGIYADELEEVKGLFRSLHIPEKHFKVVSHLPQEEAMKFLKASDALVMNYPSLPHYALYMSPLKLFEYMASGEPIVSTDLKSVRSVLSEKNSFLVAPDDSEALLRGVEQALTDRAEAEARAKRALEDVKGYTWLKRASVLMEFFKEYVVRASSQSNRK